MNMNSKTRSFERSARFMNSRLGIPLYVVRTACPVVPVGQGPQMRRQVNENPTRQDRAHMLDAKPTQPVPRPHLVEGRSVVEDVGDRAIFHEDLPTYEAA